MKTLTCWFMGLSLVASAFPGGASEFMLQFSATGFVNFTSSGVPVPTDPVTGTIIYQAADIHAPIQSFTSISMMIDGHQYSAGEIGFFRDEASPWDGIGGLANDAGGLLNFTDDFSIRWRRDSLVPFDFLYTSSRRNGGFECATYRPESSLSFSFTQVPEPATTAVLLAGAVICLACRGRKGRMRSQHLFNGRPVT